jgi:hypothetical protein
LGVTFPAWTPGFFDRDRWASSYHEAGHVVVATLLGWRVADAELIGGGAGLQARTRYHGRGWKRPEPWADLAVDLAGPMAEAIHSNRELAEVLGDGAGHDGSDFYHAERAAERLARLGLYKTPTQAMLACEQTAMALLARHWHHVVRTAETLYKEGRIS